MINGNPIFNMLSNSITPQNNAMGSINERFGSIGNAIAQLSAFMAGKGLNAEQIVRKNIQGKRFSPETIEQFRVFARQSGMSDSQIDEALKKIGLG